MGENTSSSPAVWDVGARRYDDSRGQDPIYLSCIDRAVEELRRGRRGGTVLDAGCGTGMATERLLGAFDEIVAADYSGESLRVLRDKMPADRVRLVRADVRNLPFADASFDAVLCANTLQHLTPGRDQPAAVAELRRVAKRGAPLVITVHHFDASKRRRAWIKEGKPGQQGIDYIFRFTTDDLRALVPDAEIVAVGFASLAGIPKAGRHLQNVYSRWLGRSAASREQGHMLLARVDNP